MRKPSIASLPFIIVFLASFLLPAMPALGDRIYIKIEDPYLRQMPIAIPDFKVMTEPAAPEASKMAEEGAELLRKALEYTGFFNVLSKKGYIDDLDKGITRKHVDLRNWSTVGAELLVTGGVWQKGKEVTFELRLFDTVRGKVIVGKRYTGKPGKLRKIILGLFATQVIKALTGTEGIFNTEIAFVTTTPGHKEVYACGFDGYKPHPLTSNSRIALSPAWSPDGRYLAYTSYQYGGAHLFIMNLKRKRGIRVAHPGLNITPAWKPDSFDLAATLSKSGDQEIYTLTGDGKVTKRLTENWGIDVSPTWSPDGKSIAFVSNRSGSPQIYVMNVETGKTRRLTFEGRYNAEPAWSPTGRAIAYAGMAKGRFDIYIIKPEGGEPVRLTENAGNNNTPTWSPDGTLLAFSTTREGPSRIYVMTARGRGQHRLVRIKGEQTQPSWSPRFKADDVF